MSKILVVEDDPHVRELIVFTLEGLGHSVVEAADGEAAVELFSLDPPDLIVLDIMMPKLDGWGVLRAIRNEPTKQKTRVIVLTAKSSENDFVLGWRLGIDDYLTKPFDPEHLEAAVRDALDATPEKLKMKRMKELEKSNILLQVESTFRETTH